MVTIESDPLPAWPTQYLALGMMAGYRFQPRDNRAKSKMSGGFLKGRLKSADQLVDHWFDLVLTFEQEMYFRWWVRNQLDHGNGYFTIPLHSGSGMSDCISRFVKIGASTRQGIHYKISCQIVTRDQPSAELSEAQVLAMFELGADQLQAAADVTRGVVKRY